MRYKLIVICILMFTIFLSCKKEDLSIESNNSEALLLSEIKIDNQASEEFIYNAADLISEEKSKFEFTSHHYNDKNQIVSSDFYGDYNILSSDLQISATAMNRQEWVTDVSGKKGGTINYEYNANGQVIKATYTWAASAGSEYSEFTYDANNRISQQILYWENVKIGNIDYSYDARGNLLKEILYNLSSTGAAEMCTTTRYEFDSQQNPFKSFNKLMIPGIYTNQNNIIKETCTVHLIATQGNDKVQVTENTYAYNVNGYPISKNGNEEYIYE